MIEYILLYQKCTIHHKSAKNILYFSQCTIDMIDIYEQLIRCFWSHIKLHKKGSRNLSYLLKKVYNNKRSIQQYCVSNRHSLCQILLYYKIDVLIGITVLSKKYIYLDPFYAILCNQKLLITIFREKKTKLIILNKQ